MASPFRLARLASLVASLCAAASALNLTVPETIQAGKKTEITVGFDTWKQPYRYEVLPDSPGSLWTSVVPVCRNPGDAGCANDALYEHYQLYLWYPEWMYMCYLTDRIPVGTTNPSITIPKDLGPDGSEYSIAAIEFNGTKVYMTENAVNRSDSFAVAGSTVDAWSDWESYSGWVKPYSSVPCSSYACFRDCGLRYSDDRGTFRKGVKTRLYACWNACPGVTVDLRASDWSWFAFWDTASADVATPTSAVDYASIDAVPTTLYGTPTQEPDAGYGSGATRGGAARATHAANSGAGRLSAPLFGAAAIRALLP